MNTPSTLDPLDSNHSSSLAQLMHERREKLQDLRQRQAVYSNTFVPTHQAGELQLTYAHLSKEELQEKKIQVQCAGRMMLKRVMGKAAFATIMQQHQNIQMYITQDAPDFDHFKILDLGDIIACSGYLFKTNKGELSIHVETWCVLSKALRPLPDKFHGLQDQETRYRQRYLDLMVNTQTQKVFMLRSQIVQAIRAYMHQATFLEVETPMLHVIPGGANARPFITHHHALDMPMYLRIAPELYLKRLLVGGFDRVFEINRNFRNEGVSVRHNPEFTMMEFYAAYQNHEWMMTFTQKLLQTITQATLGSLEFTYMGKNLDFSQDFARLSMRQAIAQYCPQHSAILDDIPAMHRILAQAKTEAKVLQAAISIGQCHLLMFEAFVEHLLWQPMYIIDYPCEVSPLARASDTQAGMTERFELFIAGRELANGFSELNDPDDQAARFKQQATAKQAGDDEAMYYDEDYITALEYGMPHAAGCGIGIDRWVMLLTDSDNIRDVILFPHLKIKNEAKNG